MKILDDRVACTRCGVFHPWDELVPEKLDQVPVPVCRDKVRCKQARHTKRQHLFILSALVRSSSALKE